MTPVDEYSSNRGGGSEPCRTVSGYKTETPTTVPSKTSIFVQFKSGFEVRDNNFKLGPLWIEKESSGTPSN